ncbi:S-adenosyl-L-methionine-dependent methyltransferase [Cladochytrium replicatum]|nr:S-adenosyl-L-methionine-dependent methyltransferase [Cladochytrium replicatum]
MSVSPNTRAAAIKRNLRWYERMIRQGNPDDDIEPPSDWEATEDEVDPDTPDFEEGENENLLHHLTRSVFNGNNFCGIPVGVLHSGAKVLDVGCGSGLWLCEMSREFRAGEYHGVDIRVNPWAETFQRASGNFTISIGNVLEKLPFDDNTFDYVHQRYLWFNIPKVKWPQVVAELVRVTKPGGYIDVLEQSLIPGNCGPLVDSVISMTEYTLASNGIDIDIGPELPAILSSNNDLTDISALRHVQPVGWGHDFGGLWLENFRRSMKINTKASAAVLQTSEFQIDSLANQLCEDIATHRGVCHLYRLTARKRQNQPATEEYI